MPAVGAPRYDAAMEPATPDPKRPLPPPEKDQPGGDFMLLVLAVVLLVLVGWGATELVP